MNGDWTRLGEAVREARNARGLTQAQLGDLVGVGETTIANIERARGKSVTPTLHALAREFGWTAGSVKAILNGGGPALVEAPTRIANPTSAETTDGLPLRIARALAEGTTLDTTIVPLSPGAEMVVVVKGKRTATPDEIRAALLAWEEREGHLGRLGLMADDPSDND